MSKITTLIESYFCGAKLTEDVQDNGDKHYYFEGVYAQAEIENKNGRIYPINVLKNAIDEYREEWIDTNRALGELEHPEGLEVSLDRACLRILDLHQDPSKPSNFVGKSLILDGTPKGDLVIGLLKGGTQLGVSTRGAGSINENQQVDKLMLVAIDAVLNPSAPDAFQKMLLEEQEFTKKYQTSKKTEFLKEYQNLTEAALNKKRQTNSLKKLELLKDFINNC